MTCSRILSAAALALALTAAPLVVAAHVDREFRAPGGLVDVSVEVEGRRAPLYMAPDGSGRYYLEARQGARYAVRVANRTRERLGVVLAVDGLNAISGDLEPASVGRPSQRPGRMYVLAPWSDVSVRGWRTSLDTVRRFVFVDEARSYAARTDQANRKMGWIEVRVYRERHRHAWRRPGVIDDWGRFEPGREQERARSGAASPEGEAPPEDSADAAAPPSAEPRSRVQADGKLGSGAAGQRESYPGTGWGQASDDPARLVHFDPAPHASETVTLRYEYRRALVELGVLPHRHGRDRLAERDGARDGGFARPPLR